MLKISHYLASSFCLLCVCGASFAQDTATQRIDNISADAKMQQAFAHIVQMDTQNIADLITLTEIPAPPFGEQKRAAEFLTMLKEAGLKNVSIDEVGNVVGRIQGTVGKRTIAVVAHIDTVFPIETKVIVKIEGNTYTAPGIGDNSRGLVLVLSLVKAMQQASIQTQANILFIGNVGEEGLGDLRGTKHLFREGAEKIDAFIAIDGGSVERLINGGIGSHRYRLMYSGPGGHSWGAFGLANPHHALGRAIAIFDKEALKVTTTGDKTTYNIGRIGGGTSINSIPFESWAEIDMRSGNQSKLDEIDAVLQMAAQQALNEENLERTLEPKITYELTRIGTRPAGQGDPNSSLVQHAVASMQKLGLEAQFSSSSTDANIPISLGIPAITISRGGVSKRSHSLDESWQNIDSHVAIQIALLTLVAEAGLSEN
jgi:tripeptide aminopeptidase